MNRAPASVLSHDFEDFSQKTVFIWNSDMFERCFGCLNSDMFERMFGCLNSDMFERFVGCLNCLKEFLGV